MSEVERLSPAASARATAESPLCREAVVTVRLSCPTPGRIGPVLDELVPLLQEAVKIMCDGGVEASVEVPGYHQTFYGWESDLDDAVA